MGYITYLPIFRIMVGTYKIYEPWNAGCVTQGSHIIHHLMPLVLHAAGYDVAAHIRT